MKRLRMEVAGMTCDSCNLHGDYDLLVIGAGSAAFAAAIRAQDRGARVALVEHGTVGGTCLNVGCVPSKALPRAGEIYHQAGHHGFTGIETSNGVAWISLRWWPRRTSSWTRCGRRSTWTCYLTSTTELDLKKRPGTMAVIGANAIGLELGQFFLHLGTKVLFFDVLDRIAPFEEPEISEALAGILRDRGAEVFAPARILKVTGGPGGRVVHADVGGETREFSVDHVLVATGRRPNTTGMGLEEAGVPLDGRGFIVGDEHLRTSNPKIFAAGDCTPSPQFVYVSAYQGVLGRRTRRTAPLARWICGRSRGSPSRAPGSRRPASPRPRPGSRGAR